MKKLLSIVLTVAMLFTMVACIPVSAAEGEEATVGTTALGDYYKFTFGEDGDRYDYTVSSNKADDTNGQLTYKGTTFYPYWVASQDAANAYYEYKTITDADGKTYDVIDLGAKEDSYFTPLTKDGKPFEMLPGVEYNVNIKLFNPVSDTWSQMIVSAGTTNAKVNSNVNGVRYKVTNGEVSVTDPEVVSAAYPNMAICGGSVSGSTYSVFLKEGTYGTSKIAMTCSIATHGSGDTAKACDHTSRYVNPYMDSNVVVKVPADRAVYNAETDSYKVNSVLVDETPDDTTDDVVNEGNNFFTLYINGGTVNSTSPYATYSNAGEEALAAGADNTWQIVSIEIVSENFKSGVNYSVNGEIVKTVEGEIGTALETFVPDAPEGKYFAGWYTDEACTKLFTAEAIELGNITVYAKFSDYGESLKIDFEDGKYPSTAVYYDEAGIKWPLLGYSYKGSSYISQVNKGELEAHLTREGLSTTFPESAIAFYGDRTWGMPGGIMLANPDGTLFVPKAGEMYKVTYKYRAPVNNGNNMSVKVVYGLLDSMANLTSTGDKTFAKATLDTNTITEPVTEWVEKTVTVVIPEEGEGYIPALGLDIGAVKKVAVYEEDGTTVAGYNYTVVELDYVEVELIPTTTVTYVALDGTTSTETVEVGAEIEYKKLKASRNNDVVWSLSADEYVVAPKVAEEAITVYEYASNVIGFENYAEIDYIKYSLNLQPSDEMSFSGNKSIKYENIGYSYLSSKPATWDTNWTKYYEIVDGEFVPLAGEAAPEWTEKTYLEKRGNNNTEQAIALWTLEGNKSYKISFKFYVPEALAGDIVLHPYTNGSNIWWTQTDGNGKGRVDYNNASLTIGSDVTAGEWLDGEIVFTSTAIEGFNSVYLHVGTTVEDKMVVYFDEFSVTEVEAVTFEIPEGAIPEGVTAVDNIITLYVEKGGTVEAPIVVDADGNVIDIWYDADGNEATEFKAGAYSYTAVKFVHGDCNEDEVVNGTDLALLKIHLAGAGSVTAGADCNGDGAVNGTDLAMLKLFLAGAGKLGPTE